MGCTRPLPLIKKQNSIAGPVISSNFPDPAVIRVREQYYAFSTNSDGKQVPVASSSGDNKWEVSGMDALPNPGSWATGIDTWAPDVVELDDGTFVMYYSARPRDNPRAHCIGTATSYTVMGPYNPSEAPFACAPEQGGLIDPSGFRDPATGFRYVVYKVDGNNNGNGGDCNNGVPPLQSTPIRLQRVGSDGVSPIGEPLTILDRDDSDGPLVEAPLLFRSPDGIYFLFFSSNCFTSSNYNVKYATAYSIAGPYTKAGAPLLKAGDGPNLNGPGGASISADGRVMVFHGNTSPPGQGLNRAMYTATPTFSGTSVYL